MLGLQKTSYTIPETGGSLTVCAEIFIGGVELNISLTVMLTDKSASGTKNNDYCSMIIKCLIAQKDYSMESEVLVFTSGQKVACESIQIVDDNIVEISEEMFSLAIVPNNPNITTITTALSNVTILENDNDGKTSCMCLCCTCALSVQFLVVWC